MKQMNSFLVNYKIHAPLNRLQIDFQHFEHKYSFLLLFISWDRSTEA